MPWNILLLPLVGGYFALHLCYYSKFRALRLEGHRLLLESAVVGFALLLPARLVICGLKRTTGGQWLRAAWVSGVGEVPYAGTAVAALVIGLILPIALNVAATLLLRAANPKPEAASSPEEDSQSAPPAGDAEVCQHKGMASRLLDALGQLADKKTAFFQPARDHALDWALRIYADPRHHLFRRAMKTSTPVMVTLKDRKVYVGLIWELTELRPEHEFIALLPVVTGNRDAADLKVKLHTPYPDYSQLEDGLTPEDFLVTIPLGEIQGAHLFDKRAYDRYFKTEA